MIVRGLDDPLNIISTDSRPICDRAVFSAEKYMEYLRADPATGRREWYTAPTLDALDIEALVMGAVEKAAEMPLSVRTEKEAADAEARLAEGSTRSIERAQTDVVTSKRYARLVGQHIGQMLNLIDDGYLVAQPDGDLSVTFVLPEDDDPYRGNVAS